MAVRLYFRTGSGGAPSVIPAANGTWGYTAEAQYRKLSATKIDAQATGANPLGVWASGQTALDRVFVLEAPLDRQRISGTVKCQMLCRELLAEDNVVPQLEIYVVSPDGLTVRGTLLSIGNYGSGAELSTSNRNTTFADGDAVTPVDVHDAGDLLIVCIGLTDVSGTTPNGVLTYGGTGADLPEDETAAAGTSWIEFSQLYLYDASAVGGAVGEILPGTGLAPLGLVQVDPVEVTGAVEEPLATVAVEQPTVTVEVVNG